MFSRCSRSSSMWLALCLSLVIATPALAQRAALPDELFAPVGTVITVQIRDQVSSNKNTAGDSFVAALEQPLIIDGWVVARRGQTVFGTVVSANSAGRVKGTSDLALELTEMVLVDGQQIPIRTQLVKSLGKESRKEDAATIGGVAALGTVIGAAAGGGKGALIGAAIGGGAATAGVLSTRGKPVEIYPETTLTFRLDAPLEVSTIRGQLAFLPVNPEDYKDAPPLREPSRRTPERHLGYEPVRTVRRAPVYPGYPVGIGVGPSVIIVPSIIIDHRRHR